MKTLVTGAAGFVGSHLVEDLLGRGFDVVGVDCFTPYYGRERKLANIAPAREHGAFALVEADLAEADLAPLLDGVDVVYHLAGQPGVRASWASGFAEYLRLNVQATQRLLEASLHSGVERVVYASSSSLYGNAERYPTSEDDVPAPFSPYGVTKLAAEHLCRLYSSNFGLHTVSLRYFTVFGPRQRPDLAMMKLIESALEGTPFPLYGTGEQIRDFTFVDDVVDATARSGLETVEPGSVFNVAGGSPATMNEVVEIVTRLTGGALQVERQDAVPGDVARTGGSTERIASALGWKAQVSLEDGLARQVAWARDVRGRA
jgi:nucleoside-diphosphate-sugar epimerase